MHVDGASHRSWGWIVPAAALAATMACVTRPAPPGSSDADTSASMTDGATHSGGGPGDVTGTSRTNESDSSGETCFEDADCDDGRYCNGVEACVNGTCVAGTPVECDDGIACTLDMCDESQGGCEHDVVHHRCEAGQSCDARLGCQSHCVVATCAGQTYACGNCVDDDGDGWIDMVDPGCWGPCDNDETVWGSYIPGDHPPPACTFVDCYFDQDSGAGNDDCRWSHRCDPLEPDRCTYDPEAPVPGTSETCAELAAEQSAQCHDYCGPLTPNGCDCFGCCDVYHDDQIVTVYLGSMDEMFNHTCSLEVADDPEKCNPCTQVLGCLNPCDDCEVCLGKTPAPGCSLDAQCPGGEQPCGLVGQGPCPEGSFCNTGCCQPNP
jgi:hypothetical protein